MTKEIKYRTMENLGPSHLLSNKLSDLEFVTKCIAWDIGELMEGNTDRSEKYFNQLCQAIENYLSCFPEELLKEIRTIKYKDYSIDW